VSPTGTCWLSSEYALLAPVYNWAAVMDWVEVILNVMNELVVLLIVKVKSEPYCTEVVLTTIDGGALRTACTEVSPAEDKTTVFAALVLFQQVIVLITPAATETFVMAAALERERSVNTNVGVDVRLYVIAAAVVFFIVKVKLLP